MQRDINALINEATDSVLNKILTNMPRDEHVSGTLVLCENHVASPKTVMEKLVSSFGSNLRFALFEDACFCSFGINATNIENKQDEKKLMQDAANAATLVLVAPKLSTLKSISQGDDSEFLHSLIIRSLLWGRHVYILLDFEKPRFRKNTFYETLCDTIDTLTDIGVKIMVYSVVGEEETAVYSLVTQVEVDEVAKSGGFTVFCAKNAIVTPLAYDRAKELGITIES